MDDNSHSGPPGQHPTPSLDADVEDEVLAAAARARYRRNGVHEIEPDRQIRGAFDDGERLLAVRDAASVEYRPTATLPPASGRLAITTKRLVVFDQVPLTVAALEDLEDVVVVGSRLDVMLTNGSRFTIDVFRPRLLRVELAAARAMRLDQASASSTADSEPPTDRRRR